MFLLLSLLFSVAHAESCDSGTSNVDTVAVRLTCAFAKEPLNTYFERSEPCDANDLLTPRIRSSLCGYPPGFIHGAEQVVSVETVEQLANEVVRPTRFNKIYSEGLNRPALAKLLSDLARHLKKT